ncbi:cell division ATP-binding protein FtsE [Patescibacteria group bacterium]
MIKFDKVYKIYPGDFNALENIDLVINQGEFISIVGQSGAGKSTLLKLIYAEEQPDEGKVYFEKRSLDSIKKRHLPYYRRNIGTVFQDFKLLPQKTIFENVAYALEVEGEKNSNIADKVPKILDIVGLGNMMEKYPLQLSGGEQQRASLARALIHKPKVIIADEPTGNLDPISTWEIIQLLLKINEIGTTVLLATHNKDIVDKIQKRVVALDKGRIIRDHKKGKYAI